VSDAPPTVVVPVKRFTDAKARLSTVLSPPERADLARRLADGVADAAGELPVLVVCDDDEVRTWATARGHDVAWTPGRDLNGAVTDAMRTLLDEGVRVALVAHADLPFPATLTDIAASARADHAVVVPDRHRDGTNVLAVPTDVGWRFAYGPGSFERHMQEAARLDLRVVVVDDDALGWDVDHPADLEPPPRLGRPTWERSDA
jgi:2-phospho-L-lactate guanylyltransferase